MHTAYKCIHSVDDSGKACAEVSECLHTMRRQNCRVSAVGLLLLHAGRSENVSIGSKTTPQRLQSAQGTLPYSSSHFKQIDVYRARTTMWPFFSNSFSVRIVHYRNTEHAEKTMEVVEDINDDQAS